MLFNSLAYFGLLIGTLAVYWTAPAQWRLWILLGASYLFYASWSIPFIGLIVLSTTIDYVVSLLLERSTEPIHRKRLMGLAVGLNLTILGVFKYADFFVANVNAGLSGLGLAVSLPLLKLALPLGISFYTFEAISYVVDVYRGQPAVRSYRDYALYIMFFPHLIAGPIIRSRDLTGQFAAGPRIDGQRIVDGLVLIVSGLVSKAVLADNLGALVDVAYGAPANLTAWDAWLTAVAFSGQIFFDFAGYTAMARGSALLFGFDLPRNFDDPYLAPNITEFWHRWHMSLSTWLRDYLYIPLGGSRHGTWRTYRNLLLTMGLGGFWHGANWQFALWGLMHGLMLSGHRAFRTWRPVSKPAHPVMAIGGALLTFLAWTLSMVPFRAPTIAAAGDVYRAMLTGAGRLGVATPRQVWAIGLLLIGYPPVALWWRRRSKSGRPLLRADQAFRAGLALGLGIVVWALFLPDTGPQFIYFQF